MATAKKKEVEKKAEVKKTEAKKKEKKISKQGAIDTLKKVTISNIKKVIDSVAEESKFVETRLRQLNASLNSKFAQNEDKNHLALLKVQQKAMKTYVDILAERKQYLEGVVKEIKAK